jgi:hypothetical protein
MNAFFGQRIFSLNARHAAWNSLEFGRRLVSKKNNEESVDIKPCERVSSSSSSVSSEEALDMENIQQDNWIMRHVLNHLNLLFLYQTPELYKYLSQPILLRLYQAALFDLNHTYGCEANNAKLLGSYSLVERLWTKRSQGGKHRQMIKIMQLARIDILSRLEMLAQLLPSEDIAEIEPKFILLENDIHLRLEVLVEESEVDESLIEAEHSMELAQQPAEGFPLEASIIQVSILAEQPKLAFEANPVEEEITIAETPCLDQNNQPQEVLQDMLVAQTNVAEPALPSLGSIVVARINGLRASLVPQDEDSVYHEEESSMHCEDFTYEAPVRAKPSSRAKSAF